MPSNTAKGISVEGDLQKVQMFLRKGILDETLAKLNPSDVKGTLDVVPIEIIRLFSILMLQGDQIDRAVATLESDQRRAVQALLRSARKHQGAQFAKAFISLAREDKEFGEQVGLQSVDRGSSASERKLCNEITSISVVPQLMLKSKRVFVGLGLMQDDNLLFRTDIELDDLLRLIESLLEGAEDTIAYLEKAGRGLQPALPKTAIDNCLKAIAKKTRNIRQQLDILEDGKRKGSARKKVRAKRGETQRN